MFGLILVLTATSAPAAVNVTPVQTVRPATANATLVARKQHMAADAQALLDRAERTGIVYRPGIAAGRLSKADLDTAIAETKDSLSDMNEMDQLQLQMAMDRLSKAMASLSTMLKKISDTEGGITNNVK